MKYLYRPLGILFFTGLMMSCYANKITIPEYNQDFQYTGDWVTLRKSLHGLSINHNLTFIDSSFAYPSGRKTLNLQLGRSDKLLVTVVAVDDMDTVNVGISCEADSACNDWDELKEALSKLMSNS